MLIHEKRHWNEEPLLSYYDMTRKRKWKSKADSFRFTYFWNKYDIRQS